MAKQKNFTDDDDALLEALGVTVETKKAGSHTAHEERIIAGFEEIQNFVKTHGRLPMHGEGKDIFERLYAVRLDQIRKQQECVDLLKPFDDQNILSGELTAEIPNDIADEDLLAQLGVSDEEENAITNLRHVRSQAEKKAAEEIANRTRCEDFEVFKPLFAKVQKELDNGFRKTIQFRKDAGFTKTDLKQAQFVIVGGLLSYIAEIGEQLTAPNGEEDYRLRVIYANGTESNILLRSLMRAMYKDEASRFITDINNGPLFSGELSDDDLESGTIYVLQSLSDHPMVAANRNIVHKIGVTGGEVNQRISNAKNDPTYLMADVKIIATYKLANIHRIKLEKLIHKFFASANLDIEVIDRFGKPVRSQEWFLVPLFIIDEMVAKITAGTISDYYYDPNSAALKHY